VKHLIADWQQFSTELISAEQLVLLPTKDFALYTLTSLHQSKPP
jgi:hypothetical protein